MKNDKPNYTEIENLSAYLDHELSEVEENRLRTRLTQDPELREKLEDLRLTRYTLRQTPKVRRPRSFTLSPEMVRKHQFAWRAMNFSRMVAVAASVLFAVVVGGELLFGSGAGMLASAPAENAAMVQDSAAMEAPMEEPMAMQEVPEAEMGAAPAEDVLTEPVEEAAVEEPAPEEPAAEAPPYAEETPTIEGTQFPSAADEPQETEWGVGGGAPPTETPAPTKTVKDTERVIPSEKAYQGSPTPEEEMPAGAMLEGEPDQESEDHLSQDGMDDTVVTQERERTQVPLIRWFQIGLLVLAVLSGAAAVYFRRSTR